MSDTRHRVALGAIQETMLLTLYGRAMATLRRAQGGLGYDGLVADPRAIEIVGALDYNFRRFVKPAQLAGAAIRTALIDELLRGRLLDAPRATVAEIGAGLNARFERTDNGTLQWVDVDLPDAMELRRRFFAETNRRRMVAASVLDPAWCEVVKRTASPCLIIAEGVFGYLQAYEVREALELIANELPGALVIFDTVASTGTDDRRGRRVWPGLRARVRWTCDDPRQVEDWGLGYQLVESRSLGDLPPPLDRMLPLYQYSMAVARVLEWPIDAHRVNVYRAMAERAG